MCLPFVYTTPHLLFLIHASFLFFEFGVKIGMVLKKKDCFFFFYKYMLKVALKLYVSFLYYCLGSK